MRGKVKWFNDEKGYGFLIGEDGQDVFVYRTALAQGEDVPQDGQTVEFESEKGPKGLRAVSCRLAGILAALLCLAAILAALAGCQHSTSGGATIERPTNQASEWHGGGLDQEVYIRRGPQPPVPPAMPAPNIPRSRPEDLEKVTSIEPRPPAAASASKPRCPFCDWLSGRKTEQPPGPATQSAPRVIVKTVEVPVLPRPSGGVILMDGQGKWWDVPLFRECMPVPVPPPSARKEP